MYAYACKSCENIGYTDLARSPLLPKVGISFQK